MTTPLYSTNTERTNYARLCRAIVDLCTQVLRDVLNRHIAPSIVRHQAHSHRTSLGRLNSSQWNVINNAPVKGYADFDITLLYGLLRSLVHCIAPTNGWGANPGIGDTNIGDDIERIRIVRNTVYGHVNNTSVSSTQFRQNWQILKDVMLRMDTAFGTDYSHQLNFIESDCMDVDTENSYTSQIQELEKHDKETGEEIKMEIKKLGVNIRRQNKKVDEIYRKNEFRSRIQKRTMKIRDTIVKRKIRKIEDNQRETNVALTNISQKDRIIKHTLEMIDNHSKDKVYVVTKAVQKGVKILKDHGVLIYTGLPGDGKTENALEVMKEIRSEFPGCTFLELDDPKEWRNLVDSDINSVIFLDDCLGSTSTDTKCSVTDDKIWRYIKSTVDKGHVKVIMTVRKNIFQASLKILETFEIFRAQHIIDLTVDEFKLTKNEKQEILKQHCMFNNIEVTDDSRGNYVSDNDHGNDFKLQIKEWEVCNIIKTDPLIGFPQSCFLFCSFRKYFKQGVRFFNNPTKSLIKELDCMREDEAKVNDKIQYCIMAYMVLQDGIFNLNSIHRQLFNQIVLSVELSDIPNDGKIERALYCIIDKYIIKTSSGEIYKFKHQTILEGIAVSFGKFSPDILLKHCDNGIVSQFVKLQSYDESEDEVVLKLRHKDYIHLVERILDQPYRDWSFSFDDEYFVEYLLETFRNNDYYRQLFKKAISYNHIYRSACKKGRIVLLRHLYQEFKISSSWLSDGVYQAGKYNNVNALLYLLGNHREKVDSADIQDALEEIETDIIKCLLNHHRINIKGINELLSHCLNTPTALKEILSTFSPLLLKIIDHSYWIGLLNHHRINIEAINELLSHCLNTPTADTLKEILSTFSPLLLQIIDFSYWLGIYGVYCLFVFTNTRMLINCPAAQKCVRMLLVTLYIKGEYDTIKDILTLYPDMGEYVMADIYALACVSKNEESYDNMFSSAGHTVPFLLDHSGKVSKLHTAAYFGRYDTFLKLVDSEFSSCVSYKTSTGLSVLQFALFGYSCSGQYNNEILDFLHRKCNVLKVYCVYKAFFDDRNLEWRDWYTDGNEFLNMAEHTKLMKYLIQCRGVDLDDLDTALDEQRSTLLHYCCLYNDISTLKLLHQKKPRALHAENKGRLSGVHITALSGHSNLFFELIKLGCSHFGTTKFGMSILRIAMLGYVGSLFGNPEKATSMIWRKSGIPSRYFKPDKEADYSNILEYLISQTDTILADLEMTLDADKNTLAHYCVAYNNIPLIDLIYKRYPSVLNQCNTFLHKPIQLAALLGRKEIFKLLYPTENVERLSKEAFVYERASFCPWNPGKESKDLRELLLIGMRYRGSLSFGIQLPLWFSCLPGQEHGSFIALGSYACYQTIEEILNES